MSAGVNDSIFLNTISNFTASGAATTGAFIRGISLSGGTTPYVFNNNIHTLSTGASTGNSTELRGIDIATVTTGSHTFNNFITDESYSVMLI